MVGVWPNTLARATQHMARAHVTPQAPDRFAGNRQRARCGTATSTCAKTHCRHHAICPIGRGQHLSASYRPRTYKAAATRSSVSSLPGCLAKNALLFAIRAPEGCTSTKLLHAIPVNTQIRFRRCESSAVCHARNAHRRAEGAAVVGVIERRLPVCGQAFTVMPRAPAATALSAAVTCP